mmetsp:Transcript_33567/g.53403  ORF Transcript_33567/g.53403 Transcript_33567/m.53403 type:complete len:204 (-) Transcript_33567:117-728(-)
MGGIRKTKVVVLGDSQVGKTSIITRYVHPDEELNDFYQPTIGIDFMSKMVPMAEASIRFQIWDTAGQERYRSLATSYLQEADAVMVVYDICNEASFTNAQSWVDIVQEKLGEATLIALVGNKTDLVSKRKVTTEMGHRLAQRLGVNIFVETSAQNGSNIDVVFERFAEGVLKIGQKLMLPDAVKIAALSLHEEVPKRCRWWPF